MALGDAMMCAGIAENKLAEQAQEASVPKFLVQIANTKNYEMEVSAEDEAAASRIAMERWTKAPTIGQWEIADETTDVVAVTPR